MAKIRIQKGAVAEQVTEIDETDLPLWEKHGWKRIDMELLAKRSPFTKDQVDTLQIEEKWAEEQAEKMAPAEPPKAEGAFGPNSEEAQGSGTVPQGRRTK